jgi:hypothetical protein
LGDLVWQVGANFGLVFVPRVFKLMATIFESFGWWGHPAPLFGGLDGDCVGFPLGGLNSLESLHSFAPVLVIPHQTQT